MRISLYKYSQLVNYFEYRKLILSSNRLIFEPMSIWTFLPRLQGLVSVPKILKLFLTPCIFLFRNSNKSRLLFIYIYISVFLNFFWFSREIMELRNDNRTAQNAKGRPKGRIDPIIIMCPTNKYENIFLYSMVLLSQQVFSPPAIQSKKFFK